MGPHLARKKTLWLEQEIVKCFELILHRKRENFFEKRFLVCKVNGSPSGDIQGACNVFK
jgi:hypothetical protein